MNSAAVVFEMIRSGRIKVHIGQRYALTDVASAHRDLEARRTIGATVLIPRLAAKNRTDADPSSEDPSARRAGGHAFRRS